MPYPTLSLGTIPDHQDVAQKDSFKQKKKKKQPTTPPPKPSKQQKNPKQNKKPQTHSGNKPEDNWNSYT